MQYSRFIAACSWFVLALFGVATYAVAPVILLHPEDRIVRNGTTVEFMVRADGSEPLSFEWRRNGLPLPGMTNSTLTLENVQPGADGDYDVLVLNQEASAQSAPANLTVCWNAQLTTVSTNPLTLPFQTDDQGNIYRVKPITETPVGFSISKENSLGFNLWETTYTTSNLSFGSYGWIVSSNKGVYLAAGGILTDSSSAARVLLLAIDSEGTTTTARELSVLQLSDRQLIAEDKEGNLFLSGVFPAGATADLRTNRFVFGKFSASGAMLWASYPTNSVEGISPEVWTVDRENDLVLAGTSGGYPPGQLREIITSKIGNDGNTRWSNTSPGRLWLNAYSLLIDGSNNVVMSSYSYNYEINYLDSLTTKYSPSGEQLWLTPHPTWVSQLSPPSVALDTQGNFYVALSTYHATSFTPLPPMFVLAKYDPDGRRLWSLTNFLSEIGIPTYSWPPRPLRIELSGPNILVSGDYSGNPAGAFTLHYIENQAPGLPLIRQWTTGQRVIAYQPATLEANVEGASPISFQWLFNGSPLKNETNASLTIASAEASDLGTYSLFASNAVGCALSENILLFIVLPPVIAMAGSPTTVTNFGTISSTLPLELQGQPSQWYRIERSTDLVQWNEEQSLQVGTNGLRKYNTYPGNSRGFFRLKVF